MVRYRSRIVLGLVAIAASASLSACVQSSLRQSPDFTLAVRQDVAAHIADPEARYEGTPAPASDGARAALAQDRYRRDAVIQPARATTQDAVTGGSSGAGASGGTQ